MGLTLHLEARTCARCGAEVLGRLVGDACIACATPPRRLPASFAEVARAIGLPPTSPLLVPLDLALCGGAWPRPRPPFGNVDLGTEVPPRGTVLLTGPVGVGKSRLALDLADRAARSGQTCLWVSGQDLGPHWLAADPLAADVLVLDDLDRGSNAEWVGAVITGRYERGRLTVATTNTPLARPDRPGGRTLYAWHAAAAERLADGPIVALRGASLRGRQS